MQRGFLIITSTGKQGGGLKLKLSQVQHTDLFSVWYGVIFDSVGGRLLDGVGTCILEFSSTLMLYPNHRAIAYILTETASLAIRWLS